jgi:hypothetical protein
MSLAWGLPGFVRVRFALLCFKIIKKEIHALILEIPKVHFGLSLFHSTSRKLKEQRKN